MTDQDHKLTKLINLELTQKQADLILHIIGEYAVCRIRLKLEKPSETSQLNRITKKIYEDVNYDRP